MPTRKGLNRRRTPVKFRSSDIDLEQVARVRSPLLAPVLVLNNSYEAVSVVAARAALHMVIRGVAEVIVDSDKVVKSAHRVWQVPSVIRLLKYRYVNKQQRTFTRRAIFLRDEYTCQYCLERGVGSELTLDHVMPKSRGGPNDWGNIVTACTACNNKKADRTPDEAGMTLVRRPIPLSIHARHRIQAGAVNSAWDKYLYC